MAKDYAKNDEVFIGEKKPMRRAFTDYLNSKEPEKVDDSPTQAEDSSSSPQEQ